MAGLIDVVNELQEKLSPFDIKLVKELPHIVVVGGQSAGKSSVLESFVGRDFLPRGKDIVTRRPLNLQLKTNRDNKETYAEFDHNNKRYYDFNEIREEIERQTESVVNSRTGISPVPINLKIISPDYVDLTLVDLPGMTKVPVGDQPDDIGEIIKKMILSYIEKDNCLILAVTPANQDLANSDAIELARKVDPDGKRTIGVLTKLDLMDEGTDARLILDGKHEIKLKRGFIGVVNRSQKDIENKIEMSEALENEQEFFNEHKAYRDIAHKQGIKYLQACLHKELSQHIKQELPKFRDNLQYELFKLKDRKEQMNYNVNNMTRESLIMDTLSKLRSNYRREVGNDGADVEFDYLTIGVAINQIMNEVYYKLLDSIQYDEEGIIAELAIGNRNQNGTKNQMFISNKTFFEVIRRQIESFRNPTLSCVENVTNELVEVIGKSTSKLERFPKLIDAYANILTQELRQKNINCRKMANEIIDTHREYFNAIHEDFLKAIEQNEKKTKASHDLPISKYLPLLGNFGKTLSGALGIQSDHSASNSSQQVTDLKGQIEGIKDLVIVYVNIIKKDLKDITPKICQRYLVNAIDKFIDTELGVIILQDQNLDSVEALTQGDLIEEEHKDLCDREEKLQDALDTINKYLNKDGL